MKNRLVVVVMFLLAGGCAQVGEHREDAYSTVAPTVVFKPSDSSYLLACVSEVEGLKKEDFDRYYMEGAARLASGDDQDILKSICLSMHKHADKKQFKQGLKLLDRYIDEHTGGSDDMEGLLILYSRLEDAMEKQLAGHRKLIDERDKLAAEVESLHMQIKQEQARINELQNQIDQLKDIENIIKNRERSQ